MTRSGLGLVSGRQYWLPCRRAMQAAYGAPAARACSWPAGLSRSCSAAGGENQVELEVNQYVEWHLLRVSPLRVVAGVDTLHAKED